MKIKRTISKLNKIKNKAIIMERIYPYILKRGCILPYLISEDLFLKQKLNNIFSKVNKKNNKLGEEFCMNLEKYSVIRIFIDQLDKSLNEITSKNISYNFIKSKLNYSYINYLYNSLKDYKNKNYFFFHIDTFYLKGIITDYYISLDKAIYIFLPKDKNFFDGECLALLKNKIKVVKKRIK